MALGFDGLLVGTVTDSDNRTGCTVLLPPPGAVGGMAVRGGAPATRELGVLSVASANTSVHAVALCGSSLFGLSAASGVADWCAANGIGLELPGGRFPIVGAAAVMDILSPDERRIQPEDGRAAAAAATNDDPPMGLVGAGTGCTVGKEGGRQWLSLGGQGWATVEANDCRVSALMIVNAFGSVYGPDGTMVAGTKAPPEIPRYPLADLPEWGDLSKGPTANTVIGVAVTNARLDKAGACRVADLAHTGIGRTVSPAHTNLDGDSMFAIATGEVDATVDLVAHLAAQAVAQAILAGVSPR